jgi:hypothetical protein
MKRWIALTAGLMLAFAAAASDTVRFGSRLVALGDAEAKVIEVAGQPDVREPVQNEYGANVGYRLDYVQGNGTVQIYVKDGRVVRIEEVH